MAMTKTWNTVTHKPTGKRYLYHIKLSWGIKYYSFDDEATWHKSRMAAFNHAEGAGALHQLHSIEFLEASRARIAETLKTSEINGWPAGDY
jgi:hypothetical protein